MYLSDHDIKQMLLWNPMPIIYAVSEV